MQQSEYQINSVSEGLEYRSVLNLIMAMFRLAAQDLRYGNKEIRLDARKFLKSSWFEELCDGMDLNYTFVANVIKEGSNRISTRESYE